MFSLVCKKCWRRGGHLADSSEKIWQGKNKLSSHQNKRTVTSNKQNKRSSCSRMSWHQGWYWPVQNKNDLIIFGGGGRSKLKIWGPPPPTPPPPNHCLQMMTLQCLHSAHSKKHTRLAFSYGLAWDIHNCGSIQWWHDCEYEQNCALNYSSF